MRGRGRRWAGGAVALAVAAATPAPAVAQLPPLPPLVQPPEGSEPPPEQRPPGPGPVSPAPGSVTERVDVAQTGHLADDRLVPPLVRRWTAAASGIHVVAADGRVYLAGRESVVALDQRDGRRLWAAPVDGRQGGAAYDGGRVFVAAGEQLRAFDARTGAVLWRATLGRGTHPDRPVASGGFVYVRGLGDSSLTALRASDGTRVWSSLGMSGGSPALDDARIYLVGACGNAAAYDRRDGRAVWRHSTGCSGGSSATGALKAGRLWSPEAEYGHSGGGPAAPIFDAGSGSIPGRHGGGTPTFVDEFAVTLASPGLKAVSAASPGRRAWGYEARMAAEPIAVGHDVYAVVSEGFGLKPRLVALDGETGREVWADSLGGQVGTSGSYLALAAAPGLLVVSHNGRVSAYESVFQPAADGIDGGAYPADVVAGSRVWIGGVLGPSLRRTRPGVVAEAARWRRGAFRRIGTSRPARDGRFFGYTRVLRNTRYRVRAAGATSATWTAYAVPSVVLGRPVAAGRRLRMRVTAKAPAARIGGRRFVLYHDRGGDNKGLRLMGSGRLHGRKRATATLLFKPLGRVGRRDLLVFCITGQLQIDLGRPTPLTRRCGARKLRVG